MPAISTPAQPVRPAAYAAPAQYQQPPTTYAYGGKPPGGTSGMAIASFICGLLGVSVVAIVLGFVARSQIRQSNGREGGAGLALAGIILGFVWVGLTLIWVIALIAAASSISAGG
jgi:hypothetical protein